MQCHVNHIMDGGEQQQQLSKSYRVPMYGEVVIERRKNSFPSANGKPPMRLLQRSPKTEQPPQQQQQQQQPQQQTGIIINQQQHHQRTHRQPSWMRNTDTSFSPNDDPQHKKEIAYLSIDGETDGPVPGLFSLRSVGMALFSTSGNVLWQFESNMKPLTEASVDKKTWDWWNEPEQKLAFEHMLNDPRDPEEVFIELAQTIVKLKQSYKIFVICWPACFDWAFIQYYMYKFVGDNPLGRAAKCATSYAWAMAKTNNPNVSIHNLLDAWDDKRFQHTHKALDDALEQGARFINMLRENTRNGKDVRLKHK